MKNKGGAAGKNMKRAAVLLLAAIITLLSACARADKGDGGITVAVTILPQKAFAQAVCGGLADIVTLVPPGASPETYELTPLQTEQFSKAAVYFAIGVPAEAGAMLSAPKTEVFELHTAAAAEYSDVMIGSERDPHIWLSPKRAKVMVAAMAKEMGRIDPDNAESYLQNANEYIEKLDALDAELTELFLGKQGRSFIVLHPAFGYIAADYGLEMHALEEEGKEATPKRLQELVDLAKDKGIKVIFTQAEGDASMPETFAREVGGEKVVLDPLSEDYIENLRNMAKAIAEAVR